MQKNKIANTLGSVFPQKKIKGRGAVSNSTGRYEKNSYHTFDDGWDNLESENNKLRTTIHNDNSKSIITYNQSKDLNFDRSINAYRGCEHGCIYCFARPTHAFLGLSAGLDFETQIYVKKNIDERLPQELSRKSYKCRPVMLGTNTDPYQPIERRYNNTRSILKIFLEYNHPVEIVTKSSLILRDLDIIKKLAERNLIKTTFSITTLSRDLSRQLEPRATTPNKRLEAMRLLSAEGVPVGVNFAPVIPALNDHELEEILRAASVAGATNANYILLRLPLEVEKLFKEWLLTHVPEKASHVLNRLRDFHGGKTYCSEYGQRQTGSGVSASILSKRFLLQTKKLGMNKNLSSLDSDQFRVPDQKNTQLKLF